MRVAQREATPPDPGHAPAQDVELLSRDGLGGIGQEGEVDIGHAPMVRGDEALNQPGRRSRACATG
jgi:hypothetical protein